MDLQERIKVAAEYGHRPCFRSSQVLRIQKNIRFADWHMAVGVGGGGGEEVGTFSKDINFYKIEQEILFYMIDELILSWIVFLVASRIPYRRKVEQ
jgi:hypothetical protein